MPTDLGDSLRDFERRGYCIVEADDRAALDELRRDIRDVMYERIAVPPRTAAPGATLEAAVGADLDEVHRHLDTPEAADALRLAVTPTIAGALAANRRIFGAFRGHLEALVGGDVLAQRVPNVVLQPPGHPTPTELHRDAPANSAYEIVVWLPLVDCHDTKSMYVLDRAATRDALALHRLRPQDRDGFAGLLDARAELVSVPYGSALLFWSALFHGSQVNRESATRVSLNTRYKHLFAPLGMKDPFRYFEILRTTQLTRLGLAFERDQDA